MALLWDPAATLNVISGILMGLLGGALLFTNPGRDRNRIFGLLAVFWGVQIVSANTVRLTTDADLALLAGRLSLAFLIPLYFFIVSFASIFPTPRSPFGTSPLAVAVLALPAGAALAALFLEPTSLIEGVIARPAGSFTLSWGPLLPYLVTAPFFGALSYALYVMMRRLGEVKGTTERKQVAAVLGALGLYTAYYSPGQLVSFGAVALDLGGPAEAAGAEAAAIAAVMAITVAVLVAIVARLVQELTSSPGSLAHREARATLGLVLTGAALAGGVEMVNALGGPRLELLGLIRVASVAIIVYAIARYQLFDLDLRAKRWSAAGAAVLAVATLSAAAYLALQAVALDPATRILSTAIVGAAALLPALHVSYRLADRFVPEVSPEGDHLYLRKLEVYRAGIEARMANDEDVDAGTPELESLRQRLGLDDRDHSLVVTMARSRSEHPRSTSSVEPGSRAFGKYEIEEVLARGGFGRLLLARDLALGRPVVIKELLAKWRDDQDIVDQFLHEARIAGQLNHPNIVSVYGIEEHGGDQYIIMEYVPGGTLAARLADGPLEPEEAVRVARGLLEGLSAAHAQDVVHRDVKPKNVLFDEAGRIKLADFGIAQLTRHDPGSTIAGLSSEGGHPGTLAYMSPEQAAGRPVDHRSDLYALGALLYRMVVGQPPVDVSGLGEIAARERIAEATVDAGPLPAELAPIVDQATAKDPDDRFQNATSFLQALEDLDTRSRVPKGPG